MLTAAALTPLGALALAAPALAAPANDNLANAQVLGPALPISVPATTVGATGEAGETAGGNPATESVWFSWTPSASTTAVIDLCGAGFTGSSSAFPEIGVFTGGTTFAGLTKVPVTIGSCKVRFAATAAVTYKIQVDWVHSQGEFVLGLHVHQPPANDDFAAAQAIGGPLPFSVPGSTDEATFEAGEPPVLGGPEGSRSVWFSWTAPSGGHVQLGGCPFETLPGSASNLAMGVYTGASLGALTKVVETNNCTVEFDAVAATNYKIAFSGEVRGEGTFTLSLRDAPKPTDDDLAAAQIIGPALPQLIGGDNSFATIEEGEGKLEIGGLPGSTHSVWYRWSPAAAELVKLNACGSTGRPRLGVFTGTTIATLKAANLPLSFAPFCAVELEAKAGTTYEIAVTGDTFEGSTGPFQLDVHRVRRPGNDNFAAATTIGPGLPIAVDGSNTDATVEAGEAAASFEREGIATAWYRWQSPLTGPVDISTCGSATDVFASVHAGELPKLSLVSPSGEDEPGSCPDPKQNGARDRFMAVAGTTYWIQVSGFRHGIEGTFHLTITDPNAKPPLSSSPTPSSPSPVATPTIAPPRKPTLDDTIAECRKRFPGKSHKAHAKRVACITRAKRKFALASCHGLDSQAKQERCVRAVRKKFSAPAP
jgi:hypothetical protein